MSPATLTFALSAAALMARAQADGDELLLRVAREGLLAVASVDWDGRLSEAVVMGAHGALIC